MNRARWVALVAVAAGSLAWCSLLPPSPVVLAPSDTAAAAPVRGVIHVHTRKSDGAGTIDDVAAAAALAGLQFVILSDHGDGTGKPEPASYRNGVLCIDAVEVRTSGGHVVALGLPEAPYPLGGEPHAVLEDVRRLGGLSIAAHPGSARAQLQWADWDGNFDGLEWLNADSEWRDERSFDLARALLTYPFRRAATLASLLDRPEEVLTRWDALTRRRRVVVVAASDAHARIGSGSDAAAGVASLLVPSYEQIFRTLSISAPLVRLTGSAAEDARAVIDAIRLGQVYSTIDGLAGPVVFGFSAVSGSHRVTAGGALAIDGSVEFRVEANATPGAQIVLLSDGAIVASSPPPLRHETSSSGVYRAEVRLVDAPGRPPVPWVVSNPIYAGENPAAQSPRRERGEAERVAVYTDGPAPEWRIEKSPGSEGSLDVVPRSGGTELSLRYELGEQSESPYLAVVVPAGKGIAGFDRVSFKARASGPMRLWVQLRAPDETRDRRWRRSVYLDDSEDTNTVFLDEMTPVGAASGSLDLQAVRDLLFVVDTVNSRPGSSGQVWLDEVTFAR